MPRSSYYRKQQLANEITLKETKAISSKAVPETTKKQVLSLLHSERFVDATPYQAYYTLLDEGSYLCSIRSMYRLLAERDETKDRRCQKSHRNAVKPELMAVKPNEVWSWDITKLLSTKRLVYYHLYVVLDIYSRCVVGWLIANKECQHLARQLLHKTILRHGIQEEQLTIHSDNGPSMTSNTVSQLLEHLGVLKTHNRPYTSNDNPFSESQFKTMKYCPEFPGRFESLEDAEAFCQSFFTWYNRQHYHSGLLWLTPESVHQNKAEEILNQRHKVLLAAFEEHPERFNNRRPATKKLQPAYINPPQNNEESSIQNGKIMA